MPSFDIVSKINMQEVDNAVNSVRRELTNRYDFKGVKFSIEIDNKENLITIVSESNYQIGQIRDSLKVFATKRGVDVKAFDFQKEEIVSKDNIKQIVKLKNGIEQEIAKKISKDIKEKKLKAQASIRADELRVESKNKDDLQQIMAFIKSNNYDLPLQFINFRD